MSSQRRSKINCGASLELQGIRCSSSWCTTALLLLMVSTSWSVVTNKTRLVRSAAVIVAWAAAGPSGDSSHRSPSASVSRLASLVADGCGIGSPLLFEAFSLARLRSGPAWRLLPIRAHLARQCEGQDPRQGAWFRLSHFVPITSGCTVGSDALAQKVSRTTFETCFHFQGGYPTGSAAPHLRWQTAGRRAYLVRLQHPEGKHAALGAAPAWWHADLRQDVDWQDHHAGC